MAGTSWYVSHCKDCINMNLNDRSKYDLNKAWCSERREYIDPYSNACSNRFQNDDVRNKPSIEPCYLTTIVCEILGYPDNCSILNTLRVFREEFLKTEEQYHDLLCEYDIVGPILADAIRNCLKPNVFATFLLENYIEPTVNCIKEGKYDLAVMIYQYMVNQLKTVLNINSTEYSKEIIPTGKGYIKG